MQRNTNPPPNYARPPTPKAALKAKDNCLNIGRDDIAPAMFMHVPRAPERSKDRYGYQCYFGGGHHAVQNYIEGGWVKASVFRDTEKYLGEVQINLHLMEGGSQDTSIDVERGRHAAARLRPAGCRAPLTHCARCSLGVACQIR